MKKEKKVTILERENKCHNCRERKKRHPKREKNIYNLDFWVV